MGRRYQSFQRAVLKFIAILLGILLALMLGITAFFQQLQNQAALSAGEVPSLFSSGLETLFPGPEVQELNGNGPTLSQEEMTFSDHNTKIGGKRSGIVNILLIGQDRRAQEEAARSDTMILCTFNKQEKTLTLTSFLRDLYVEIPGYESNRLNAAYANGGADLLNDTLEENFGIVVDANVQVDFSQFSQIVNMLGGVSMELRQDEADAINRTVPGNLTEGVQWLTGEQALAYSRIRNLDADGDFSRTNRQRKVLSALLEAYKDADLKELFSVLKQALPMIETDLGESNLFSLAVNLLPALSGVEIQSQRIPADGTYENRSIQGMSVLVADLDAARALLRQSLLGID